MKTLWHIFMLVLAWLLAQQTVLAQAADTIRVTLNNGSQTLIILKNQADWKTIKKIDFNQLLAEIDSSLDEKTFETDNQERFTVSIKTKKTKQDTTTISEVVISSEEREKLKEVKEKMKEKKKRNRKHITGFGLDLGLNNYLENGQFPDANGAPYTLSALGSRYVAISFDNSTRLGNENSRFRVKYGLNIAWNNFMFQDDFIAVKGENKVEFVPPTPPIGSFRKNKLVATTINIPAMLTYRGKKNPYFTAGMGFFVGYRVFGYTKIKYNDENDRSQTDKSYSNFYMQNLNYGITGEVGVKHVRLFFNYHLNPLFFEGKGPNLQVFSTGIRLL